MLRRIVTKRGLRDPDSKHGELTYWLGKPPEERVAAVNELRSQYYGSAARLQRVARVVHRAPR